jgi:hypothetical protein
MFRHLFFAATVLAFGSVAASADVFNLTTDYCSGGCLGGGLTSAGTVTITQVGLPTSGIVDVIVQLASGFVFHTGNQHNSVAFNISGDPLLSLDATANDIPGQVRIVNAVGQFSFDGNPPGSTDDDGAGHFDYDFNCIPGNGNNCANGTPTTLEFHVDLAGLTPASFETLIGGNGNVSNSDLAVDVFSPNGNTGNVGAVLTVATVPEPTSIVLLGSVLVLVGTLLKKRLAV